LLSLLLLEELKSSNHISDIIIDISFNLDDLPTILLNFLAKVARDKGFMEEFECIFDKNCFEILHFWAPAILCLGDVVITFIKCFRD
jgi:hypothetical protein